MRVKAESCPECKNGKHINCDGEAWSVDIDGPVPCACGERGHE